MTPVLLIGRLPRATGRLIARKTAPSMVWLQTTVTLNSSASPHNKRLSFTGSTHQAPNNLSFARRAAELSRETSSRRRPRHRRTFRETRLALCKTCLSHRPTGVTATTTATAVTTATATTTDGKRRRVLPHEKGATQGRALWTLTVW